MLVSRYCYCEYSIIPECQLNRLSGFHSGFNAYSLIIAGHITNAPVWTGDIWWLWLIMVIGLSGVHSDSNNTSAEQDGTTAKRESSLLITSMITDRIGRHDVLLPIILIITITIPHKCNYYFVFFNQAGWPVWVCGLWLFYGVSLWHYSFFIVFLYFAGWHCRHSTRQSDRSIVSRWKKTNQVHECATSCPFNATWGNLILLEWYKRV